MALVINSNIASLTAQRNLNKSQGMLNQSLQRLSSGLRINSAKDDAAGLAIANRFTTQIRGLNQAIRNANDGVSLAQTAEGALVEATNILQRIRELAVQSSNATNSASDRAALNAEVNQLKTELSRIASTTSFNGLKILDGSYADMKFQVGAEAGASNKISVSISSTAATDIGNYGSIANNKTDREGTGSVSAAATQLSDVVHPVEAQTVTIANSNGSVDVTIGDAYSAEDIAKAINAKTASTGVKATAETKATLSNLSAAGTVSFTLQTGSGSASISASVTTDDLSNLVTEINKVTGTTGVTASQTNGVLTLTEGNGKDISIVDFSNSNSATNDTIVFKGSAESNGVTLTEEGSATEADTATAVGEVSYTSSSAFSMTTTVAASAGSIINGTSASATLSAVNDVDITTATGADDALSVLDSALESLSTIRSDLGALQARFESTIGNLQTTAENLSAARSAVQDADFAAETAALTKAQILQQAGVSILAQANANPQAVLALLQ